MRAASRTLQICSEEALAGAGIALQACIDRVIVLLRAEEAAAQKIAVRNELALAWLALQKGRDELRQAYVDSLGRVLERTLRNPAKTGFGGSDFGALDAPVSAPGELTLVGHHQVEKDLAVRRLLQQVAPLVDAQVGELDGLVSGALGLDGIDPERNPFRPELFVPVLQSLLDDQPLDPGLRAHWSRHLGGAFGRELGAVLTRIAEVLSERGVQAPGYRTRRADDSGMARPFDSGRGGAVDAGRQESGGRPGGVSAAAGHGGDGAGGEAARGGSASAAATDPARAIDPVQGFGHWVRNLLQGALGHLPGRLAPDYHQRAQAEYERLLDHTEPAGDTRAGEVPDYRELPPVNRPARVVSTRDELDRHRWGQLAHARERALVRADLRQQVSDVAQATALECVHRLVDQVGQDERLLAPVREAMVALEPSLVRLAMADPQFLADTQHPGRQMLERIAQRSLRYNDEYGAAFADFMLPVSQAIARLSEQPVESAQPVARCLEGLEQGWAEEDEAENRRRLRAQAAVQFAEERQRLADSIAFELSQRTDLAGVPGPVLDFLYERWALVMAHARLIDERGLMDPGGYGVLVSSLLWSAKREFTLRQPGQLIEMIPSLLGKINEGLDLIGADTLERTSFLDQLMELHKPVLDLTRRRGRREPGSHPPPAAPAESVVPPRVTPGIPGTPWLSAAEREVAGFSPEPDSAGVPLDSVGSPEPSPVTVAHAGAPDSAPASLDLPAAGVSDPLAPPEIADPQGQVLAAMRTGDWVDLQMGGEWLRAQLQWRSEKASLFLFVSHGGRAHTMTRRSCLRLLSSGRLRGVRSGPVVETALDAVLAQAEAAP